MEMTVDQRIDQMIEEAAGISMRDILAGMIAEEKRAERRGAKIDERLDKMSERIDKQSLRDDKISEDIDKLGIRVEQTIETVNRMSRAVGRIVNNQGKIFEAMFSAKVWDKFKAFNYEFTRGSRNKFKESGHVLAEVDTFLENGEYAMAVEVKSVLTTQWVDEHLERLDRVRAYMDSRGDTRILVGAVAGGIVSEAVQRYAEKHGLYVLTQNGNNVSIAEKAGFQAKEWKSMA